MIRRNTAYRNGTQKGRIRDTVWTRFGPGFQMRKITSTPARTSAYAKNRRLAQAQTFFSPPTPLPPMSENVRNVRHPHSGLSTQHSGLLQSFQHLQHPRIALQKLTMRSHVGPAMMKRRDTLKPPAAPRPILVDRAAILLRKKHAPPLPIRQHVLNPPNTIHRDRHRLRKRREFPPLLFLQQHRILMPVLHAARRRAQVARACPQQR